MDVLQKTPWGAVPYGLSKRPADSGDQQAFGLAKCAEAVALNEPLFLIPARYCATYSLAWRPVLHREPNGNSITPELHRWLVLQNVRPHHDQSVSPDRLGKEEELDQELTQYWEGMDFRHYRPDFEVAAYVLTGSPMLGFMLHVMAGRFRLTLTLPSTHPHRNRSTSDMGAARAFGRMHQAADWLAWALHRHDLLQLVAASTDECIALQWTGKDVEEGLARPLCMECHDHLPGGCGWRPTFEALGLMGLAIVSRAGSRVAYTVGHAVVRSLLRFGLEPNLESLWGMHWFEDAPGVYPTDPSLFQVGDGRWGEWAVGFLLRWAELERALSEEEVYERILEVVRAADARYGTPAPNAAAQIGWAARLATGPSLRHSPAAAYDVARGVVVLFGGLDGDSRPPVPTLFGDTWEWKGAQWRQVALIGPSPRMGHGLVFGSKRQEVVLFGSNDGNAFQADTWAWTGARWR